MWERIGAIPAPPPTKTISLPVSFAKNSPKGPEIVTSSPGFSPKSHEVILPGGTSGIRGGGDAIRTFSRMTPRSSG